MAELTRQVPAERTKRHLVRRNVLDGAGQIFALGAGVQEVRRIIEVRAEGPVGPGVSNLAIDFVEARHRFSDVAAGNLYAEASRIDARGDRVAVPTRVVVVPKAEVE